MGLKGGVSAMELFPRRPSTILDELTKLENMMPAYKEELFKVSKFIRRNVWGQIDDRVLLEILRGLNFLYSLAVDTIGQDFAIVSEYVKGLSLSVSKRTRLDIHDKAQTLRYDMWQEEIQKIVLKQWVQLDTSRWPEFDESELYRRNLLQIMNDFGIR